MLPYSFFASGLRASHGFLSFSEAEIIDLQIKYLQDLIALSQLQMDSTKNSRPSSAFTALEPQRKRKRSESVEKQLPTLEQIVQEIDTLDKDRFAKGGVYIMEGIRKKWNGKRFTRCCSFEGRCTKLAQGATGKCILHGGQITCKVGDCDRFARGGSLFCADHRAFSRGQRNSK